MYSDEADNAETNANLTPQALIAYRLGRVEKLVESINVDSIARDDRTNLKLDALASITNTVNEHSWRLSSLELSRSRMWQFISGITVSLVVLILSWVMARI